MIVSSRLSVRVSYLPTFYLGRLGLVVLANLGEALDPCQQTPRCYRLSVLGSESAI